MGNHKVSGEARRSAGTMEIVSSDELRKRTSALFNRDLNAQEIESLDHIKMGRHEFEAVFEQIKNALRRYKTAKEVLDANRLELQDSIKTASTGAARPPANMTLIESIRQRKAEAERVKEVEKDILEAKRLEGEIKFMMVLESLQKQNTQNIETKILSMQSELIFKEYFEEWYEDRLTVEIATEYDDYKNHVDEIIEIEKDAEILGAGVDVTLSTNESLGKKLARVKRKIESGELGEIKYNWSFKTGKWSKVNNIPNVVIALDVATVKNLWYLHENLGSYENPEKLPEDQKEKYKSDLKKLRTHIARALVVEQLRYQLKVYSNFARSVGNQKLAERFGAIAEKFADISEWTGKQIENADVKTHQSIAEFKAQMGNVFGV